LQLYNIKRINECGGYATLVYPENLDVVMKRLEDIANGKTEEQHPGRSTPVHGISSSDG